MVAGLFEHESAAAGAIDRAFEVVVVLLRLVADDVVLLQDRLHRVEGLRGDQRLVRARVGHAAIGDDALVVRVGEDLVQQRRRDGLRGERRSRPRQSELRPESWTRLMVAVMRLPVGPDPGILPGSGP